MPQDGVRPSRIVAQIKMSRTQYDGAFLIVEGQDDKRFWGNHCHDCCRLVDGKGKNNVMVGVQRLEGIGIDGVLGVVDSNHDYLEGRRLPSANLVATDAHDLECMLCRSPALDAVLVEFGDADKIRTFEGLSGMDVRAALLKRGAMFGQLRWAARQLQPGVRLEQVRPERFVERKSWQLDEDGLIETAVAAMEGVDEDALRRQLARLPSVDPWYLASGHELLAILRLGLQGALGKLETTTGVKELSRALRLALRPEDLRSTRLWYDMRGWERSNSPYLVLGVGNGSRARATPLAQR